MLGREPAASSSAAHSLTSTIRLSRTVQKTVRREPSSLSQGVQPPTGQAAGPGDTRSPSDAYDMGSRYEIRVMNGVWSFQPDIQVDTVACHRDPGAQPPSPLLFEPLLALARRLLEEEHGPTPLTRTVDSRRVREVLQPADAGDGQVVILKRVRAGMYTRRCENGRAEEDVAVVEEVVVAPADPGQRGDNDQQDGEETAMPV